MDELRVRIEGREHTLKVEEFSNGKLRIHFKGDAYDVETVDELPFLSQKKKDKNFEKGIVTAPLPGVVTSIKVKAGEKVNKGNVLATVVAMKMENEVVATKSGIVKEIKVKKDQNVKKGDILLILK